MASFIVSKICKPNTTSERASKWLQNACYSFKIKYCKLNLQALKDSIQHNPNTKGYSYYTAHGTKQKLTDLTLLKICALSKPSERAFKKLQNVCFNFDIDDFKLKL